MSAAEPRSRQDTMVGSRFLSFRLGGLAALALVACDQSSSSGGAAAPAQTVAEAAPHASATHLPPPPPPPHGPPPPCKAATVVGSVTAFPFVGGAPAADGGSTPVLAAAPVPDEAWIDVGKASRLTARDSVSTRETTFEGPGRFRVCIGHKEEAWVKEGTFRSVAGAGERPGGEQWVATPLGAVRYDGATMKILATDRSVDVEVAIGAAYYWPATGVEMKFFAEAGSLPGENDQGWVRLNGGTGLKGTVAKPVLTTDGATAALERCMAASKDAMALTASLGEADASLAELAPRDIVARRLAHAACDVAYLRIDGLPPSAARDAALDRVRTAEAGWKSLMAPTGQGTAPKAVAPTPSGM